ncbi:MAG TPA: hypothetical protein VFP05_01785 [Thermomicrobiales bacterium]|nr:hypothetical protein [Thermomicrobiales bacterium]
MPGRPTVNQLLLAVAVLVGAVIASFIAGPGFGLLVVTLALLASGLWIAYGSAPASSSADHLAAVPAETARIGEPESITSRIRSWPVIELPEITIDRASLTSLSVLATFGSVLAIVLTGAVLFLRDRDVNPAGFFADEAEIGVQSWKLLRWQADTTTIPFFYHHLEYEHLGSLTLYATAPFVGLFGLTEHAVRGASAFWTIAAAIMIYFTLRRLRLPYAVVPVLITLMSPLVILVGRTNFGHAPSLFTMSAGFLLWIVARQREQTSMAIAAGVLIGLSAYGQSSYYIAAPLLLLAIGVTELAYNRLDTRAYKTVAWAAFGTVLILLPVPYRALTYDPFLDRYRDKTAGAVHGLDRVSTAIRSYPDYFSFDMLFLHGTTGWQTRHSIPGAPWFFRSMLIFLLIGLVSLIAVRGDSSKRFVWPMALVLLLYPIPDLVSRHAGDGPYSYSLIWASIGLPFVVGYGFVGIRKFAGRISLPRPALLYAGAALLVTLWGVVGFWRGPFANYPNVSADYWGWQFGAKPITDYFKAHPADYDEYVMSGDFNAAYILEEFYMHESPIASKAHTGGLEYLDLGKRQIFAVRTSEWESAKGSQYPSRSYLRIVQTIDYPNGMPAFYLLTVDPALLDLDAGENKAPVG